MIKKRLNNNLLVGAATIIFIIWSAAFIYRSSLMGFDGVRYFSLFDDAMISMRYAWNFSHGNGLVWNPGVRVEGYSNLLMTLIMSLATFIFNKSYAVLFVQVFGVLTMIGIAFFTRRISKILLNNRNEFIPTLAFICVLGYYPLTFWSLMGMETGLLALFIVLGIYYGFMYFETGTIKPLILSSIYWGFAFIVRNDSLIYAGTSLLFLVGIAIKQGKFKSDFWKIFMSGGILLIFFIGQFVFRYVYYGEFAPNTYVLKLVGMPLLVRLSNGFGFLKPLLIKIIPLGFFIFVDYLTEKKLYKLYFLSLIALAISYQVYVGGDPWRYWRMIAPVMPLFLLLIILTSVDMFTAFQQTSFYLSYFERDPLLSKSSFSISFASLISVLVLFILNFPFLYEAFLLKDAFTVGNNWSNVNRAILIDRLTTEEATIGVTWAGSIPYYLDRVAIDFLGKSDSYIANLDPDLSGDVGWDEMTSVPGHNKYDLDYSIKTLKPTFVQSFVWGSDNLTNWQEENYTQIKYMGVTVDLLSGSPFVNWDKVEELNQ